MSSPFINSSSDDIEIITRINNCFEEYDSDPFVLGNQFFRFPARKGRLSFYPISKNLRMLATSYSKSIADGTSFGISHRPRRGEINFVKSVLGWSSWYPWIWVRHLQQDAMPLSKAWQTYFESNFSVREFRAKKFRVRKYLEPLDALSTRFVLYCEALSRLFILSNYSKVYVSSNLNLELLESPFIALHIRRGENVSKDGSWIRPGFTFVELEEYLHAVNILAKNLEINRIYLACDSVTDMDEVKLRLENQYEVFSLNLDRSRFVRHVQGHIEDVETWCQKNTNDIPFYALSGIAELFAMSNCSGIVGSIGSSEFAKTGWLLACSRKRR